MKTAKQILIDAKELISNPKKWTTKYWAKNEAGESVSTSAPEACQWCSWGALMKVQDGSNLTEAYQTLEDAIGGISRGSSWKSKNMVTFNDDPDTTHADVMAAFDRAIKSL